MSRSELYCKALQRMLDADEHERITEQIEQALVSAAPQDEELAFLSRAAAQLVEPHQAP